ncbi:uncharacterized protein [Ptychodera flava]|uniref:uncharacterized protein n=1 Tax=Ptychodera flava TaxID=63121 RepID=UPI003969D5EB
MPSALVRWDEPTTRDNSGRNQQSQQVTNQATFLYWFTEVLYKATDSSSNTGSCHFNVVVQDQEIPIFTYCPSSQELETEPGLPTAVAYWTEPNVKDNSGQLITISANYSSGDEFQIGVTVLTFIATDSSGNVATCESQVLVKDIEAPVFHDCPRDQTVGTDDELPTAIVTWMAPNVTDNSGTIPMVKANVEPGQAFPIGITTVIYTADDGVNTETCSFTVTVNDDEPPTITYCPGNLTKKADAGRSFAAVQWDSPTATDNSGDSVTVDSTHTSGSLFAIGTTQIEYQFEDGYSNSVAYRFQVTVNDYDECEVDNGQCQHNCVNTEGSYNCTCNIGYQLNSGRHNCDDINECLDNTDACEQECINTDGSYRCDCTPGFQLDSDMVSCLEINECDSNPCVNGTCIDKVDDYECICTPGFGGKNCEIDINECASTPCQNGGSCTDLINGYQCRCLPGYSGNNCSNATLVCIKPCQNGACVIEDGKQTCKCANGFYHPNPMFDVFCEDIDECVDSSLNDCTQGCSNTDGTYSCDCRQGYELAPDGKTCLDIDECASNPCPNGMCIDLENGYNCTCKPGYTGTHCEKEIDECETQPCAYGTCEDKINSYICHCSPGYTGPQCNEDVNECASFPCQNDAYCTNLINKYECTCTRGWTGENCDEDVDECSSRLFNFCHHTCNNVHRTQDDRGYTCSCLRGFRLKDDSYSCEEIDECESNPCQNDGTCVDDIDMYMCQCSPGWEGINCQTDVNECVTNTHDCDDKAYCTNTIGSYTCTCEDGYRGDGFKCREIIFLDFGTAVGDSSLRQSYDERSSQPLLDLVSRTIRPSAGFPFWNEFYYSLYFTDNGLIVFMNENDEKYPFPHPYEGGFTTAHRIPMIAVFWEDSDMTDRSQGDVFYQEYHADNGDSKIFEDVNNRINANFGADFPSGFSATWALKITWYEVADFNVTYTKQWPNSFQAILATDGIYGFVVLNYREDAMLWNYEIRGTNNVIFGYNGGDGNINHIENIQNQFDLSKRYRPDLEVGDTGLQGRWILRVENNNQWTINTKKLCLDWYERQPDPWTWNFGLGGCPCGFDQGQNDNSFGRGSGVFGNSQQTATDAERRLGLTDEMRMEISDRQGFGFTLQLAYPNFFGAGQQCAYRSDHSLIEGYENDVFSSSFQERWQFQFRGWFGFTFFYFPAYLLWLEEDLMPRQYCCALSRDPSFCELYKEKRPPGQCQGYIPPHVGWMFGDPHLQTLDGLPYTFNGLGEYTLVIVDSGKFILQGRTVKAKYEDGNTTSATIFTAFAAKQRDSSTKKS